jgi:hypothetical protein
MYIRLGKFADAVEGILQLLFLAAKVFVAGTGRYGNQFAEAHQDAGKRFGNDEAVPPV